MPARKFKRPTRHPLEQFRLRKDWSYDELARDITRVTGIKRTGAAWGRLCQKIAKPTARTQYAIDQYLASIEDERAVS